MSHGVDKAVEESATRLKTVLEHQITSSDSIEPLFDTLNDDINNGSRMIRFDTVDRAMSELVMPQLAPVEQQEIANEEDTDQITNLEFDSNDFLVDDDDQLWAYQFPPFSPGNFMFLDDMSEFDYNPSHV
ncbi:hypothetical protein Bca52824_025248 [Brassica carinata]|uniref:Uncharacterized protein n=1 Tax=Brassica carinata TaxID=52824 RepID=A0A8X7VLX4_BRACI|nr:hypothetical protein Bca52824_025248 [Brassica carinata]